MPNKIHFYMMMFPGKSVGYAKDISYECADNIDKRISKYNGEPFNCGSFEMVRYENNQWLSNKKFGTFNRNVSPNILRLIITPNVECKCQFSKNCINAIANGECTDKFMIDIIGKQFFTDKYAKQK